MNIHVNIFIQRQRKIVYEKRKDGNGELKTILSGSVNSSEKAISGYTQSPLNIHYMKNCHLPEATPENLNYSDWFHELH